MDKLEKIKVLIVEDDLLIAENLKDVLIDLGYAPAEPCSTMKEARQLLQQEHFDIAMLDINLNGKDDGLLLGKHISEHLHFPFIFLTSFSDKETIAQAVQSKPSAYLVKPVSPPNLFASIQTALHNFSNNNVVVATQKPSIERAFFVKIGNTMHKIQWDEVVSIRTGKNYVTLQTNKEGAPDYPIRSTLQQILACFIHPDLRDNFIQVNRSQCVNKSFVQQIQNDQIITPFGAIEIGEKYKKMLLEKIIVV